MIKTRPPRLPLLSSWQRPPSSTCSSSPSTLAFRLLFRGEGAETLESAVAHAGGSQRCADRDRRRDRWCIVRLSVGTSIEHGMVHALSCQPPDQHSIRKARGVTSSPSSRRIADQKKKRKKRMTRLLSTFFAAVVG
jgi:hypothetical protein